MEIFRIEHSNATGLAQVHARVMADYDEWLRIQIESKSLLRSLLAVYPP